MVDMVFMPRLRVPSPVQREREKKVGSCPGFVLLPFWSAGAVLPLSRGEAVLRPPSA
jgi:hypothetical protein